MRLCFMMRLSVDCLENPHLFKYYSTPVRERSIAIILSVCVSVCASVCLQAYLWNRCSGLHAKFFCRFPVAVARSSSGGVAICYVLPVLWMTSRLAVVGRMAMH